MRLARIFESSEYICKFMRLVMESILLIFMEMYGSFYFTGFIA